jgi:hypothetical protein
MGSVEAAAPLMRWCWEFLAIATLVAGFFVSLCGVT